MKLMLYIKCILVAIEGISATGLYKVSSSLVFLIGKVALGIGVIIGVNTPVCTVKVDLGLNLGSTHLLVADHTERLVGALVADIVEFAHIAHDIRLCVGGIESPLDIIGCEVHSIFACAYVQSVVGSDRKGGLGHGAFNEE